MLKCSNEDVRGLSKVLKNQRGSNCENVRRSARENTNLIMIMVMVIIMTMIMTMIMMMMTITMKMIMP